MCFGARKCPLFGGVRYLEYPLLGGFLGTVLMKSTEVQTLVTI